MTSQKPCKPVATGEPAGDPDQEPKPTANDPVGYGRPPKATQFKRGKSGNPKGRPKGARTVGAILQDVIAQKIAVTENGKTRRVPAVEGLFRRVLSDALRGDLGAVKLLMSFADRYADSPETKIKLSDMMAEDRQILEQYLHRPDTQQPSPSEASATSASKLTSDEGGNPDADL
jgi:hypothetical protein